MTTFCLHFTFIPPDFDHSEAESRHLIYEADTDADSKLTKDEILDKYDLFVGSQVNCTWIL